MKKPRTMAAMEAKTLDEVCALQRDNFTAGDYWLLTDGDEVTVCAQRLGESPTGKVSVPRAAFNRLLRAYMKQQRLVKSR